MLRKRLLQLGAEEFAPIGLGDDQAGLGYFAGYDAWIRQLAAILAPGRTVSYEAQLGPEEYLVSAVAGDPALLAAEPVHDAFQGLFGCRMAGPFSATVISNTRLTADSWEQVVKNIKLEVLDPGAAHRPDLYSAGDVAVVHPENPASLVHKTLSLLNISGDVLYSIERVGRFGGRRRGRIASLECTAFVLFTRYLDIAAIPQRGFFEMMSFFATDEEEKEKLLELASGAGTDLYIDYCFREKRNFIEVLEEFRSCHGNIPLHRLLEVVPTLKPRQYSIASAPSETPGQVSFLRCYALWMLTSL